MTNRQQWTFIAGIVMTVVVRRGPGPQTAAATRAGRGGRDGASFHATDLRSGRPISLADYRGKVILLNVWATWCRLSRRDAVDGAFAPELAAPTSASSR